MANEVNITMTAKDLASGKIKGVGDQAKTSMDKLRGMRGSFLAVGAAGGAVVGALGLAIKSFAQTGDEIQKMSLRTALSTVVLSEYKFALEQSGSSVEGFEKSIRRMSSFIQDGRDGLTTTTDALDTLGVSVKDLEGLGVEDAFVFLSSALADVEDDITQAALAQDLFGRSGTALLPMLAQGADGIAALREEARELGIVFTQDMADGAARVIDAQNTMRKSTLGLQMAFAQHLAPALSKTLEVMGKVISAVSRFANENPVLTKTLGAMAFTIGTLAIGIAGIGIALPIAASMMAGLGTATAGTALAFVGFNLATGGILLAIGLVVAGIVLLIQNWDAVVRAMKIGANALITAFEFLFKEVLLFYINNAIRAFNLLAGVFGKSIDLIEVDIKRFDTSVQKSAEVVDESSQQIGTSLGVMQDDFTETAVVAEDAYKSMTMSASEWNKNKIAGFIEASKSEEAMWQRKRDGEARMTAWEEEQRQLNLEALEESLQEELRLEEEFNAKRLKGTEAFWTLKAAKSSEEFDRLAANMLAMPSVMNANGSAAGGDEKIGADVMRSFKASQNRMTDALAEAQAFLAAGEFSGAQAAATAQAEVDRLLGIVGRKQVTDSAGNVLVEGIEASTGFKGDALGAQVLKARNHVLGGAPPGMGVFGNNPERSVRGENGMQKERLEQGGWTVIVNAENIIAEDLPSIISRGLTDAEQLGAHS